MGYSSYDGFGFMFNILPAIVSLGFIIVLGMIIIIAVKGVSEWSRNNNSPVLTVSAKVVAKRAAVSHHTHHNGDNMSMHHASSSTDYYITFEVESGDRMELRAPDREYGMIAEGDSGKLTFQGTRYRGFERVYKS